MLQRRSMAVPVEGGELFVELTGPQPGTSPQAVLFLHDLAGNALSWRLVAARVDAVATTIAVDARGRAASSELPPPFGMHAHLTDLVRLLDHLQVGSCVVVGHGTGALTASNLARWRPDIVDGAVFVDGGLPLLVAGDPQAAIESTLLPVLHRLRATHSDRAAALLDARRRAGRSAIGGVFDESVLHDLGGRPPLVRSRTNENAVWFDGSQLLLDPQFSRAVEHLGIPIEVIELKRPAPRPHDVAIVIDAERLRDQLPNLHATTMFGLDHEDLLFTPHGADAVSRSIARVMARCASQP